MLKVQTELHLTEDQVELIIQRAILMGFAWLNDPASWDESLKKKAIQYVLRASIADLTNSPTDEP